MFPNNYKFLKLYAEKLLNTAQSTLDKKRKLIFSIKQMIHIAQIKTWNPNSYGIT